MSVLPRVTRLLVLGNLCAIGFASDFAFGFSLGVRPYVGAEMITIPATKLVDAQDPNQQLSTDRNVSRTLIYFGSDLALTPLEFGKGSVSAFVGYRMMSSSTADSTVNDAIKIGYVPIGVSVDYALKKLRASGYFSYDLGMAPSFKLSVKQPVNELDLKMAALSRMRFGTMFEFFFGKSISVFASADYATGSFKTDGGPLTIFETTTASEIAVNVVPMTNKLSALTFGGGLAYYILSPASQLTDTQTRPEGKTPGRKPGTKVPTKKGKPKPAGGNKPNP